MDLCPEYANLSQSKFSHIRKIECVLSINETVCPKHPAWWYRLWARDCARSLMNKIHLFFFFSQNSNDILTVVTKDHSLRKRSKRGRRNYIDSTNSWIALLSISFGGEGDLWCAGGFKFSHYIQNLDKNFDIKTATIIFLFSSFKVAAKLGACLPSFPPGGKLCGWVINTLMDPAGTVSCNLICREIIWVIDRDKRLLLDNGTLSLALQKTFKNFPP